MFNAIQNMATPIIWCGVIWAFTMGVCAGSYACSLIHRWPRGSLILDKAPYCGNCGAWLQVKDLFPIVSATLLGHKCRYCHQKFPISHTVTEIIVSIMFVLAFLQYGFNDTSILILSIGTFLVTLAAIEVNENIIMGKVMICILVMGMLLRTLLDHELFGFVQGGLTGLIIGAIIWHKSIVKDKHIYRLPKQAELMCVAGIAVGFAKLPLFIGAFTVTYAVMWVISRLWKRTLKITIPFGFALFLVLMYSDTLMQIFA